MRDMLRLAIAERAGIVQACSNLGASNTELPTQRVMAREFRYAISTVLLLMDMSVGQARSFDGDVDPITLTAAEIGLPEPERKYAAVTFTLGGELTDAIDFDASYTWSHTHGNTEGLVKTDNDQADPGWTTSYDYADLMDHGSGDLPNDHRHALKLAGLYSFTDNWIAGVVFRATSGAPKSVFSIHPAGVDNCASAIHGRLASVSSMTMQATMTPTAILCRVAAPDGCRGSLSSTCR